MTFKLVRNEKEERERLQNKYKLKNPYDGTLVGFRYCVFDEEKKYCLVGIAAGRGREEQQPNVFAFISPKGIAYMYGYERCLSGETHWSIESIKIDGFYLGDKKKLYEKMKQALIAYSTTEDIKTVIDFFPEN